MPASQLYRTARLDGGKPPTTLFEFAVGGMRLAYPIFPTADKTLRLYGLM